MNRSLIPLAIAWLLCACNGSPSVSEQIEGRLSSEDARLDLTTVGPKDWERVCVLGPYTNNQRAEEILEFHWDSEAQTSISSSDVINVLVFIRGNDVVAYDDVLRSKADFADLDPPCLPRSSAVLVRKSGGSGWPSFVAQ
jgi:hypothetical protein